MTLRFVGNTIRTFKICLFTQNCQRKKCPNENCCFFDQQNRRRRRSYLNSKRHGVASVRKMKPNSPAVVVAAISHESVNWTPSKPILETSFGTKKASVLTDIKYGIPSSTSSPIPFNLEQHPTTPNLMKTHVRHQVWPLEHFFGS